MTINDIMLRYIADAERGARERKERERAERGTASAGDECGLPWLAVAVWLAVALAGLGAAFCGGMWFQAERTRKADCANAARSAETDRETARWARGLSNVEILAKGRECASAD